MHSARLFDQARSLWYKSVHGVSSPKHDVFLRRHLREDLYA